MTPSFLILLACLAFAWGRPLASQAPKVRAATLLWQVDGSESGEPFGALRDLLLHRDGSAWALDSKDQVIRRYDARGKALPTIGRKGSGPRELRNANGMAMAPDGSVWVNDPGNARRTVYTAAGKTQRTIVHSPGGYRFQWGGWFDASGRLIERDEGDEHRLRLVDQSGQPGGSTPLADCGQIGMEKVFIEASNSDKSSMLLGYPFTEGGGFVGDRRGHVWCATRTSTRMVKLALGRQDTVTRTSLEIPMRTVESKERDVVLQSTMKALAQYRTNNFDASKVPTRKAGISAFSVDNDGRLWVLHTPPWLKMVSTFDVFDGNGRSLFRVELPVHTHRGLPILAKGDELTLVTVDEDEIPHIARFRLR